MYEILFIFNNLIISICTGKKNIKKNFFVHFLLKPISSKRLSYIILEKIFRNIIRIDLLFIQLTSFSEMWRWKKNNT